MAAEPDTKLVIQSTIDGVPLTGEDLVSPKKEKKGKAAGVKMKSPCPYIWGIYITLLIFSVIELYSASSREVTGGNIYAPLVRHARFLIFGFVMVLLLQRTHYKWFRKAALPLAVISILMLIYVAFFGANYNNAQRAILVPGFGTIQPPEIAKLTCMLYIASVMAKHQMRGGVTTKGVIIAALAVVVFCGCTIMNGLTNTIILMGVSLCMFLIGGIQWKKLAVLLAVYGIVGIGFMVLRHDHADALETAKMEMASTGIAPEAADDGKAFGRSETWGNRIARHFQGVNPDDPITDDNRQVILSNFAQANGGFSGLGPGKSRETARLPLAFCDYIYAIIIEDTGFLGAAALLIIYLCLLGRAGSIASKCSRAFPALLIMGCAVIIVLQALIHMAIVVGLFPVSGQPLPLISKGGTSILVMSAAFGMMLSVSRFAVRSTDKKEIRSEMKELPEDLQAENPTNVMTQ